MSEKRLFTAKIEPFCYTSTLDCDDYTRIFLENGYCIVDDVESADAILLNPCSVCDVKEKESVEIISKLIKSKKSSAELFIIGCFKGNRLEDIIHKNGLHTFRSNQLLELSKYLNFKNLNGGGKIRDLHPESYNPKLKQYRIVQPILEKTSFFLCKILPRIGNILQRYVNTTYAYSPKTYYVRVGSGCANSCSYCLIKKSRGPFYSVDVCSIKEEIKKAIGSGFTHFLLVSDDFASYGLDVGKDFTFLLNELFDMPEKFTVTIYNFNPMHCIHRFDDFIKAIQPGRIKCLHYVAQSGSDKLLKKMNRGYTSKEYIDTVLQIQKKDSGISLRTDFLIGFPGETIEDHQANINVLEKVPFVTVNFNVYKDRPGTLSMELPDKISDKIKFSRQKKLIWTFRKKQLKRLFDCMLGKGQGH